MFGVDVLMCFCVDVFLLGTREHYLPCSFWVPVTGFESRKVNRLGIRTTRIYTFSSSNP